MKYEHKHQWIMPFVSKKMYRKIQLSNLKILSSEIHSTMIYEYDLGETGGLEDRVFEMSKYRNI